MKNMKGVKQAKAVEVKFDPINGISPDGTHWELEYNKVSKRYNLRSGADQGGDLFYSHISLTACQTKATEKEVVWN